MSKEDPNPGVSVHFSSSIMEWASPPAQKEAGKPPQSHCHGIHCKGFWGELTFTPPSLVCSIPKRQQTLTELPDRWYVEMLAAGMGNSGCIADLNSFWPPPATMGLLL